MSQDILGSLVRALVTVPEHRLGLVQDFVLKMAGSDGETWETEGKLFLRKQATWKVGVSPAVEIKPEATIDQVIHVDRSIKPTYPDWVKKVLHPELESVGPTEYDASSIDQWLDNDQNSGNMTTGYKVYATLKEKDMKLLKTCLGLRDLEEIKKKGINFFWKHFRGKAVFGWASVTQNHGDNFSVPYLYERGNSVVLSWRDVGSHMTVGNPALRHVSSPQT